MASFKDYHFDFGNTIRVTVRQILDEGEGDIVDIPEGAKTAPISVRAIEYNKNPGGEADWEMLKKHTNLGQIMSENQRKEARISELEQQVERQHRVIALYEGGEMVGMTAAAS